MTRTGSGRGRHSCNDFWRGRHWRQRRTAAGNLRTNLCMASRKSLGTEAYKQWILKTIEETWTFFQKKFITFWNDNRDEHGEAYLVSIYDNPELHLLAQKKYITELFHDSLGFGAAKMIRRIVGVAHVEDFESISDSSKRAHCERHALNCGKLLLKERRRFQSIEEVISVIQEISAT